jgi:hypothetical protein
MMRHNIIVAAAVVALTGCSDDLDPSVLNHAPLLPIPSITLCIEKPF